MMKKIVILLMSAVLLSVVSCKKTPQGVPVVGVELDKTEIELGIGETAILTATVLPEDATDKTVTWSSSAPEIASVDEVGTVQGLAVGDAVITVTTADGGKTAECIVTVSQTINGHEYVDLGLSIKWATCNVGAENPWDYGDYFAWGETEPKDEYTTENCITYMEEIADFPGDPEYDAAAANWGGTWRLPTCDEAEELLNDCTWELATEQDVSGYKVTGPNGNSIFLPSAGYHVMSDFLFADDQGYYLTCSTGLAINTAQASFLAFYNRHPEYNIVYLGQRHYGRTARPVSE